MVRQIIPKQRKPQKIVISTKFIISLAKIKQYGEENFGKAVSNKFITEIRQKIEFLSKQPNANPKNRFIESTTHKTYRNIIHKNYTVLYSVTKTTVAVIDIYHSARNPQNIQSRIN